MGVSEIGVSSLDTRLDMRDVSTLRDHLVSRTWTTSKGDGSMRLRHWLFLWAMVAMTVSCGGPRPSPNGELVGHSAQAVCSHAGLTSDAAGNFAAPGTLVTWTAAAGCDSGDTPSYQFWIQPPGDAWTVAQDWSPTATWAWDTTGDAVGVYNFQVWIRAQGSTSSFESFSAVPFTLANVTSCSSVSASTSPTGQTSIGDNVTIASSATCGSSTPEFQIWMAPPGDTFSLLQDYSTSSAYNWDTSGALSGMYSFQVWVRAVGSPGNYDSYTGFSYTLGAACSSVTGAFAPMSPAVIGDVVDLSAAAACGGTPTYQFWELPPGGGWTVLQDWSTNSSYSWDTSTAVAGTYNFQVWTKNQGSTASYESYASAAYTLSTAVPCADAAASTSLQSPQPAGTPVTLTGAASACSSPQYEFWELDPGGSWGIVQAWSSTSSFIWTGSVAGAYNFQIWVREGGSTGQYETYAGLSYQLN
jgi:hypothetical protein